MIVFRGKAFADTADTFATLSGAGEPLALVGSDDVVDLGLCDPSDEELDEVFGLVDEVGVACASALLGVSRHSHRNPALMQRWQIGFSSSHRSRRTLQL
jgi:hypothetical protein